jgi:chemosensory pili system protein ChpA (sensor histidine kinase/response regulator)
MTTALRDAIDFTALGWVKPELDETLRQARLEIEAYAEDPGDTGRMQACAQLLHQVQGSLRMLELYAPAMVGEEMETLATTLASGQARNRDEASAALMRGVVLLPDYLERLQGGHRDIPIVLLPLLNELRAARGAPGLNESVLFAPDLHRPLPAAASTAAAEDAAQAQLAKFSDALAQWPDSGVPADASALAAAADGLVGHARDEAMQRMLWVAASMARAMQSGAVPASAGLRQAFGGVEREARHQFDGNGLRPGRADAVLEPTRQLLYHAAQAGDHPALQELRQTFDLDAPAPTAEEIEHARGSVTGRNRALLDTVAAALKEDLLRVKDALDLHLRTGNREVAELLPQVESLGRISDTLGMLGLGTARHLVAEQEDALRTIVSGERQVEEGSLLDIAGALLFVDASLDDQVARLGTEAGAEDVIAGESRKVLDVLVREAIANFADARQAFVAFVETNWDHSQLSEVPRLLREVEGALRILELPLPSDYLVGIRRFTESELIARHRVPNGRQLDTLADALASLEYYLEALREQRPHRDDILEIAHGSLESLGYWPLPPEAPAPVETAPAISDEAGTVEAAAADTASTAATAAAGIEAAAEPVASTVVRPVPSAAAAAVGGFDTTSDEIDDEIREVFLEEFEEEIRNLDGLLPPWRATPEDLEKLRPIRRVFHTLKGSGRLVGAKALGEFSWKIEGMLNRVLDASRPASPAVVAMVDQAFYTLPQMHAALRGEGGISADLAGMEAVADRIAAGEDAFYGAQEAAAPVEPPVAAETPAAVEPEIEVEVAAPVVDGVPADVDPVLLEILDAEVLGHLATVENWLQDAGEAAPASDALLRAVHTMNGAFAMTEVPAITEAVTPAEAYLKRALAAKAVIGAEGIAALAALASAVQGTVAALKRPEPRVARQGELAARFVALRDALPEPPPLPTEHELEPGYEPQPETMALEPIDADVQAEADRIIAEKAEAERLDAERIAAEKAEADRLAAEQAAEAERLDAERVAAEQAEAERIAAEKAEADRLAAEQAAEAERLEAERIAAERAEADRLAAEQAEADRVAAEEAEYARLEAEYAAQAAAEKAEAERVEAERLAAERAEAERVAAEQAEAERLAAERAEAERIAAEKADAERIAAERAEAERLEAEQRAEQERIAAERRAEEERIEAERRAAEDRAAAERREAERVAIAKARELEALATLQATAASSEDPDEALDLSELDPELVDIFTEESGDLLDHSDGLLAQLREHPHDRELLVGLQRDLHTLKGGARMAGIMAVGELGHSMESLLEAVVEHRGELGSDGVPLLERGFDRLHAMVTRVNARRAIGMPEGLIAEFTARARGEEVPAAIPGAATERKAVELKPLSAPMAAAGAFEEDEGAPRAPQEQVRIRADLLDRLVNYAGEVAIYRARLEQQLGAFRSAMVEMEQTNTRLRDQLRRLDSETEAQIIARYQREHENEDEAFDPLELDRFSTLQQLSRALAESAADMSSLQGTLDDLTRQYETLLLQQSRVSSDLQEGLMRTRMLPFDSLVPRLRRVVRQAAGETGKQVQLRLEGAQGELDRNVLEHMTAPLEHMLRNAVAHGIEAPADRRSAKKAEEGSIAIAMRREGSEVVLEIRDDGAGLNRDAIRKRAIERGLIRDDAILAESDLDALIMEPGFSTAETVSRLAGRGVGMDVVASEVRQLGGSLDIKSKLGEGTAFILRLPQTLAVTQAVFVRIGETTYAVPIASVRGVGRISRDELGAADTSYRYGGEDYPVHDLGTLLGHAPAKAEGQLQMPLLLVRAGDLRAAVLVDQVVGNREIVVKPVGPQVASVPGIFGATIMGDGRVVVILDVAPLARRQAVLQRDVQPPVEPMAQRRVPLVMVVDDSVTMRKVTGRVLERHNLEVATAKDGIDALERMAERVPDLMLLDIEMPRMDGYELATAMRAEARLRDVPIIMITSRTGEKHRQRAMEIGVQRYLGKPYQEPELMRNVFELLAEQMAEWGSPQ